MLTNILLTALLLLIIGFAASGVILVRRLRDVVIDFITPAAENQPSHLANTINVMAGLFAQAVAAQLKATFMGIQSGQSRAEKGLQGDIALDLLSQSPIGPLLTSFPSVVKTIKRNPGLLDMAMGLLSSRLGGGGVNPSGNNGNAPKFRL